MKWEYYTQVFKIMQGTDLDLRTAFNALGEARWEMVNFVFHPAAPGVNQLVVIFKRPKKV